MHAVTAARLRADRTVDAFARTHRATGAWCTVLASAYESSFSAGWGAAGAQLCNDTFERAWAQAGAPLERFDRAIGETLARFRSAAHSLWTDDEWADGSATGSLIAVLHDGALHVRWLGDHVALLVRNGAIVAASEPHTLAGEIARHGIDPIGHPQAGILLRSISVDPVHEPDRLEWACHAGDHLIVASGDVVQTLRHAELAALVGGDDAATRIVEAVVERAQPFGAIATVIRT